jgi:hypothetical protein
MSEILTYHDGFTADGQITKMGTFTSKGGGLTVQVQLPLDAGLAGNIAMHLGNIAQVSIKFSSVKKNEHHQAGDAEDLVVGQQSLDFLSQTAADEEAEAESDDAEDEAESEADDEATETEEEETA